MVPVQRSMSYADAVKRATHHEQSGKVFSLIWNFLGKFLGFLGGLTYIEGYAQNGAQR